MKYVIAFILTLLSSPSWGMTFTLIGSRVQATGPIKIGTLKSFLEFSRSNDLQGLEILLDSPGGITDEALGLGRMIRKLRMNTGVGIVKDDGSILPGTCSSICPFVLLAGVRRRIESKSVVEVHQLYISEERERNALSYEEVSLIETSVADLVKYLNELHASTKILDYALRVPYRGDLKVLSPAELKSIGVKINVSLTGKRDYKEANSSKMRTER